MCGEIWKNKNDDLNIFAHQNIITLHRAEGSYIRRSSQKNEKYKVTGLKTNAFGLRFTLCAYVYEREEGDDQCNVFWWMMR